MDNKLLSQPMKMKQLLDRNIVPVRLNDQLEEVENLMFKLMVSSLPVVDNEGFLGFVLRESLFHKEGSLRIEQVKESFYPSAFIDINSHWFDVLKEISRHKLNALALLDGERYVGVITSKSLLQVFAKNSSVQMPGTIMVLEISVYDYMLSRIAQITEERNVKIMYLNVEYIEKSSFLRVHLKLNTHEVEWISREFERYGFHILKIYHNNSAFQEDIMDNYDALMKYLNV